MKRCLVVLAVIAFSAGGYADVEYLSYEGSQQNWAIAPGAIVDRRFKLPVYHGPPPRLYVVRGTINVSGAGGFTQVESATRDAIAEARTVVRMR